MIRIVHLIKSILNENSLATFNNITGKTIEILILLPLDFIFVLSILCILLFKITKKRNSNISPVLGFFFRLLGFLHMFTNWTHINIFEYHVFNTQKKRIREDEKMTKTLQAHAHIIERKQIQIFHDKKKCKEGKANESYSKRKTQFKRCEKRKKTVYHTK